MLDHGEALRAAMHAFLADGDLDLRLLAVQLRVSRATLYRVVGNRDKLLGDVLWELARRTLVVSMREAQAAHLTGMDLLLTGSTACGHRIRAFEPLRRLLHSDPTTAFRVLFTPDGGVHQRTVDWWTRAFAQAVEAGDLDPTTDVHKLAYVHVRICESMLYADLLAGREPDLDLAEAIQRSVIGLSATASVGAGAIRQHRTGSAS